MAIKGAGGCLSLYFSHYLLASLSLLFCFICLWRRRERRIERAKNQVDLPWDLMAETLFGREPSSPLSERIDLVLGAAAKRLGLTHGMVTLRRGSLIEIRNLVSIGYDKSRFLTAGMTLDSARFLCGSLRVGRAAITIDFASLSEWRKHPAHAEMGWETYIGAGCELRDGEWISVSFFQSVPRDNLYSPSEKAFVTNLANWVATLHGRELEAEPTWAHAGQESPVLESRA